MIEKGKIYGKGEVPGPPVWFEEEDVQEAVVGVGYQPDNQQENDIFFYHTDHLQSTTYLTDSVGNVSQFVWYAPYGEALIDEQVGSYENPYKFSGKELDENTGLYDHGARHREPSSGVWYGVDALFEKYPEFSPYSYCGGNPVRFVDMDGREFTPEAEIWVRRLENEIARIKEKYDKKSSTYNEAVETQTEIDALRASKEVVYDVRLYREKYRVGQLDSYGRVGYDQDKNQFVISLNECHDIGMEGSELGSFAHELKHAYQFEIGCLSFLENVVSDPQASKGVAVTPGFLYDYVDEVEAHSRGETFGSVGRCPDSAKYPNSMSKNSECMTDEKFFQYEVWKSRNENNRKNIFNYHRGDR